MREREDGEGEKRKERGNSGGKGRRKSEESERKKKRDGGKEREQHSLKTLPCVSLRVSFEYNEVAQTIRKGKLKTSKNTATENNGRLWSKASETEKEDKNKNLQHDTWTLCKNSIHFFQTFSFIYEVNTTYVSRS